MIRLLVIAAMAAFAASPLAAETVRLRAGHLIDPGSGRVTHDRLLTLTDASLIDDEGLALAKARGVWLDMDSYNGDWIEEVGTRDGWLAEYLKKNRDTTDLQRQGFARAVKLGVPLTFGSDAGVYPHGLNARQFRYMVRYGMTPMQALAIATSEAAKALGRADLGSVAPGHAADFVAVGGDPLKDISVLQCVDGVIQGGRLVHRPDAAERCDRWTRK